MQQRHRVRGDLPVRVTVRYDDALDHEIHDDGRGPSGEEPGGAED